MLKEIAIMRPLLIVQLVVYHAFIVYWGGWNPPMGYKDIALYGHIAGWSYAYMLESFTFMSGYVWLYTCQQMGVGGLKSMILKKTKRLLIPMFFFGIVYFVCFMEYKSFPNALYEVLNGAGHLWYLPMLFWCFVEAWLLKQIKVDERIKLIVVALLAVFCSELPIPFRIATSFYYLFFFYLPVLLVGEREHIYKTVNKNPLRILIAAWVAFIFAFVLIRYVWQYPHSIDGMPMVHKAAMLSLNRGMQLVYSTLGVIAFYLTAVFLSKTSELTSKGTLLVKIGSYCFGVYIFQQFVLKGFYFYTSIPEIVGPYWLPWLGVALAIVISFVLTYLIRLTKVGRAIL